MVQVLWEDAFGVYEAHHLQHLETRIFLSISCSRPLYSRMIICSSIIKLEHCTQATQLVPVTSG